MSYPTEISPGGARTRERSVLRSPGMARRTPLWATALAGLLVLSGVAKSNRRPPFGGSASDRQSRSIEAVRDDRGSNNDRGRQADTPADIPARGWKDIAYRIYNGISEDRIVALSAGVTFFVLLALFPGIAGLISLYGIFADSSSIGQDLDALSGVLPEGATQVIGDQIQRLTSQPPQKLGFAMIAGLVISLWSANGGMKAMFDALNIVYHEKEKRGFIRLNAISLAVTVGAIGFVLIALISITVVPMMIEYLGLSSMVELVVKIARWPLLLLVSSFCIAVIYRYGPSRDKPKWRWITPGSILAACLWLAASLLLVCRKFW